MKTVPYIVAVAMLLFSLFYAGSVFAHSEPAQISGGGGYVHGWVYGFTYDNYLIPISWANVTASNGPWVFRAATAANGGFEMFLPSGTYNLTATEPGYVSYSMVVAVANGSTSAINFYLEESHVPIPEFQPQLLTIVVILSFGVTTLAKRRLKHVK